jgi:hypothetical protein
MTKLLILVAAVVAIVWLLRRAMAGSRPRDEGPRDADAPAGTPQGELVSCAHCAVNLPKAEAYAASGVLPGAGGRFYCSEEHWRLGPRDG